MKRNMSYPHFLASLAALCLVLAGHVPAWAIPQWSVPTEVSQGRAFVVTATDVAPFEGSVVWRDTSVPLAVKADNGVWTGSVMLALPMDAKGQHAITLKSGQDSQKSLIMALSVPWHEERLTVEPRYVTPPQEVQTQIKRDQESTARALANTRTEQYWSLPFQRPVKGTISGSFGGRRVFNEQPRSPHKGTDMRGPTGTPILAAADGVVILAEPQYYSGNVVYVDHGQGVVTMYAHLSAFKSTVGQNVAKGDTIGLVGATGRVTGPHLHFGMLVQGVGVDAMPLCSAPLAVVGGPTKLQPRPADPAAKKASVPKKDAKAKAPSAASSAASSAAQSAPSAPKQAQPVAQ